MPLSTQASNVITVDPTDEYGNAFSVVVAVTNSAGGTPTAYTNATAASTKAFGTIAAKTSWYLKAHDTYTISVKRTASNQEIAAPGGSTVSVYLKDSNYSFAPSPNNVDVSDVDVIEVDDTGDVTVLGDITAASHKAFITSERSASAYFGKDGQSHYNPQDLSFNAGIVNTNDVAIQIDSNNNTSDSEFGVYKNSFTLQGGTKVFSVNEDGDANVIGALNHDGSTAGLYGATPVAQAAHIADVTTTGVYATDDSAIETAINAIIAALEGVGIAATS